MVSSHDSLPNKFFWNVLFEILSKFHDGEKLELLFRNGSIV